MPQPLSVLPEDPVPSRNAARQVWNLCDMGRAGRGSLWTLHQPPVSSSPVSMRPLEINENETASSTSPSSSCLSTKAGSF
ncbi:hypothetical protein AOLI_G00302330 [Acnodon oligacanthus]